MKIKGTFLSYISAEKKLRKEQTKVAKGSSRRKNLAMEDTTGQVAQSESNAMALA